MSDKKKTVTSLKDLKSLVGSANQANDADGVKPKKNKVTPYSGLDLYSGREKRSAGMAKGSARQTDDSDVSRQEHRIRLAEKRLAERQAELKALRISITDGIRELRLEQSRKNKLLVIASKELGSKRPIGDLVECLAEMRAANKELRARIKSVAATEKRLATREKAIDRRDASLKKAESSIRKKQDAAKKLRADLRSTWPHEYIVREKVDEGLFVKLVEHIRASGYEGFFYKKKITYYDEDGLVYWTMGAPVEETTIINRCRKEQTYEYRLAHDDLPT